MYCIYKDNMWATAVLISKSLTKYVSENVAVAGKEKVADKKRYNLVVLLAVFGRMTEQLSVFGLFTKPLDKIPDNCGKECFRQLFNDGSQDTSTLNRVVEEVFSEVDAIANNLSCSGFKPFYNSDNKKISGTIIPLLTLWYIDMVNLAMISYRRSYKKEDFTNLKLWPLKHVFEVGRVGKLNSIMPVDPSPDFGDLSGKFNFDVFNANAKFSSKDILDKCFTKLNDQDANQRARDAMSSEERADKLCKFLEVVTMKEASEGIEEKIDARGAKAKTRKRADPDPATDEEEGVERSQKKAKTAKKDRSDAKSNDRSEKKRKTKKLRKKTSSSNSVAGVVTEVSAESTRGRKSGPSLLEQVTPIVNEAVKAALKESHPDMSDTDVDAFMARFEDTYKKLEKKKPKKSGEEEDEAKPVKRGRKRHRFVEDSAKDDLLDTSDDDSESSGDESSDEMGSSEDDSGDESESDSEMNHLGTDDVFAIDGKLESVESDNFGALALNTMPNGCAEPTLSYDATVVQGIMGENYNRQLYDELMSALEVDYVDNNKTDENVRTVINWAKMRGYSAKVVIYEIEEKKNKNWEWTSKSPITMGDKNGVNVVNVMRHIKNGNTIGYYTLKATEFTS